MGKYRFYVKAEANDDAAYREAMTFACDLAEKLNIDNVIILIRQKTSTDWFERLYGADIVKQLHTGKRFKDCRPLFKFETLKIYSQGSHHRDHIVITVALDDEEVGKIDDTYSQKAIIVVPWLLELVNKYLRTFGPKDLRSGEPHPTFSKPTCIVQKAMEDLTDSINMSTGITHPGDNDLAKTYIRSLFKYEDDLDENIVGAYLKSELGWLHEHAKEIEKLIEKLNDGKSFKGGDTTGLQHHYKQWQKQCADR